MHGASKIRILFFSCLVIVLLLGGVCIEDNQAKGLMQSEVVTFTKTGKPATFSQVGDVITYTYTITNNTTATLIDILIDDAPLDGEVTCPSPSLSANMSMNCTARHTVTAQDVTAGSVSNSARLTAWRWAKSGGCCTCSCNNTKLYTDLKASFTATLALPALELTKTGSPATFSAADQQISYSYVVKNTGSTLLTGPVQVQDDLTQVACPAGDLAPGQSLTCTASYTTTAEDVAAGAVTNNATASAGDASASDDFTVTLAADPALGLTKSADPTTFSKAGTLIHYTFTVTNTGNVPLEGPYELQDPLLDQQSCPQQTLGPGASLICDGYYLTQAGDLNSTLNNCARVRGYYLGGPVRSPEACTSVFYQPPPNRESSSACDIDPNSIECICEQDPNNEICG